VSRAVQSDDVADTLNYATLYETARQEMAIPSQLLEHVAGRIGQRVLSEWSEVTTVDLTLTKENPPMGADCDGASVELHLINDKTQG
jgi:dihydroneopterin aldolase